MLSICFEGPIELSSPKEIQTAITEALEEELEVIAEQSLTRNWSQVREILHGAAKQRFFKRVTLKLPSTLQWYAIQSYLMNTEVIHFHMKYENLDTFLISLNYFLCQQADLYCSIYSNAHADQCHELPQTAPERSALFNFLTNFTRCTPVVYPRVVPPRS